MQENLPGYTLLEALALSAAGMHSGDGASTYSAKSALKELIDWLDKSVNSQRAKRLLLFRRLYIDDGLASRVVEGKWNDEW